MEMVFLVCFLFGALFTIVSVALGAVSEGLHVPHHGAAVHGIDGHAVGHANGHAGAQHAAAHATGSGTAGHHIDGHGPSHATTVQHGTPHDGHTSQAATPHHGFSLSEFLLPLLNISALVAFLTWFGAAGYLALHFGGLPLLFALPVAVIAGLAGAALIAWFLRLVFRGERVLDRRDFALAGTMARVSVSIPADGAGEVIFTKAGSRRGEAARSMSGVAIPRETEVVIVEYDRGMALVEPISELMREYGPAVR